MNLQKLKDECDYINLEDKNININFDNKTKIFTTSAFIPMNNNINFKSLTYLSGFITLVEKFKNNVTENTWGLIVFIDNRLFQYKDSEEYTKELNNLYKNNNNSNNLINILVKGNYQENKEFLLLLQKLWLDYINKIIKNNNNDYNFIKIYSYDINLHKAKYKYPGLPDTFGSIMRMIPFFYSNDNIEFMFSINCSHHITKYLYDTINKYLDNELVNNDYNNNLYKNLLMFISTQYNITTDKIKQYFEINYKDYINSILNINNYKLCMDEYYYDYESLISILTKNINYQVLRDYRVPIGIFGAKKKHRLYNFFKLFLKNLLIYYYGDINEQFQNIHKSLRSQKSNEKAKIFEYGFDENMLAISILFYDVDEDIFSSNFKKNILFNKNNNNNNNEKTKLSHNTESLANYITLCKDFNLFESMIFYKNLQPIMDYHKYLILDFIENPDKYKGITNLKLINENIKILFSDENKSKILCNFYIYLDEFFSHVYILNIGLSDEEIKNDSFNREDETKKKYYSLQKNIFNSIKKLYNNNNDVYEFINIEEIEDINDFVDKIKGLKIYSLAEIYEKLQQRVVVGGNITNKTKKKNNYFTLQSRLTKGQRKYCSCLMHVRDTGVNPYGICRTQILKAKKKTNEPKQYNKNLFNVNCTLAYDYDKYTDSEIQALAKERKIPLTYKDSKTGKRKKYSRHKLVENITKKAITKLKKSKKQI